MNNVLQSVIYDKKVRLRVIIGGGALLAVILAVATFYPRPVDCAAPLRDISGLAASPKPSLKIYAKLDGLNTSCGITKSTKSVKTSVLPRLYINKVTYSANLAKVAYQLDHRSHAKELAKIVMTFNASLTVAQRSALQKDNQLIADMLLIRVGSYTPNIYYPRQGGL